MSALWGSNEEVENASRLHMGDRLSMGLLQ